MTLFIDLKEKIKKFFVLKSEKVTDKNTIWGDYIRSQTSYVNGAVYIHESPPTVHKQEFSFATFNVNQNNEIVCVIGAKGKKFAVNQLRRTVVLVDDTVCAVKSVSATNDVATLIFDNVSVSGNLKVQIPSYNDIGNVYSGLIFQRQIVAQSMTFTPISISNSVSFSVTISHPYPLQQVKASTIYRTGQTNYTKVISLPEQQSLGNPYTVTFTIPRGSQDVGVFVELVPYTVSNITYGGCGIKQLW